MAWWLGYVFEKGEEHDEVKITFLHPCGPAPSFSYLRHADVLWLSVVDILARVNPVTPTGITYALGGNDVKMTQIAFSKVKSVNKTITIFRDIGQLLLNQCSILHSG